MTNNINTTKSVLLVTQVGTSKFPIQESTNPTVVISKPLALRQLNRINICRCVKSKCLKLYCECFQKGVLCNSQCKCVSCSNNVENEMQLKSVRKAYLLKNPRTFTKKPKAPGSSCSCRTNR